MTVRIEGVDTVMLCRDENDIMPSHAGNLQASKEERLSVDIAIDLQRE